MTALLNNSSILVPDQRLRSSSFLWGCLILLASSIMGCSSQEDLRSYTVAKPRARTLGAMLVVDDRTWFFKLTGHPNAVGPLREGFDRFLESIRRGDTGEPDWELPDGWTEERGSGMRYATIKVVAGNARHDMSVIPLPSADQEGEDWILQNVNRWRGQLDLDPLTAGDLDRETTRVKTQLGDAIVVDIEGIESGGGMSAPFANAPFASGGAGTPPRTSAPVIGPPVAGPAVDSAGEGGASLPFDYETPDAWAVQDNDSMSVLAFSAGDSGSAARVTVTPLAAAAADLTANVNRWRGQIGLEPLTGSDLTASVDSLQAGGKTVNYVKLYNDSPDSRSILGVIAIVGRTAWFLKMIGPTGAVRQQQDQFESFVESIEFTAR